MWYDEMHQRRMLVGVLAAGCNLQLAITGVGPVIDDIRADTGMSSAAAGLLQTVPFLCIGVFALAGFVLVSRLGPERLVAIALPLISTGAVVRAVMPSPPLLVVFSVPLGLGVALMSVSLPTAVKLYFRGRMGAVTGAFVAALGVGSAAAALTAVPLAHAFGSWRVTLGAAAVPAALALPLWLRATHGLRAPTGLRQSLRELVPSLRALPRPPRLGPRLALLFASQSVVFASLISWVAALYRDHGWSSGRGGLATAVISLITIPAALLVPGRSDGGDRRPWLAAMATMIAVATFAMAFVPTTAPWVWIAVFAFGTGAIFPLCLALPLDVADDDDQAALLTAWMLGLGYCCSSLSPAVIGGLRDLTGGFTAPMAALGAVGLLATYLSLSPSFRPRPALARAAAAAPAPSTGGAPAPDRHPGSGR
jgi:MFS transporter, CP family, cyanate transporter